jgi:hypothetical protein
MHKNWKGFTEIAEGIEIMLPALLEFANDSEAPTDIHSQCETALKIVGIRNHVI